MYQICVKGLLDNKWESWFKGFTLSQEGKNTVLTGPVPDQSALHGLLAVIRDLGLPLLSVNQVQGEGGNR